MVTDGDVPVERVLGRAVQGATEQQRRGQQLSGRDRVDPFVRSAVRAVLWHALIPLYVGCARAHDMGDRVEQRV